MNISVNNNIPYDTFSLYIYCTWNICIVRSLNQRY